MNCISTRSAPQLLFIKYECTFRFTNYLIIDLRNFSANSWFDIILFSISDLSCISKVFDQTRVTAPPEDSLSKIYKPLKQNPFQFHHIKDF